MKTSIPSRASAEREPVVVIGAGMAGLSCAVTLHEAGMPVVLIEAADRVGGRVATDHVDGFTLDRGFQVYLPAYPDAAACLNLEELDLRPFFSGALIRRNEDFGLIADPMQHPLDSLQSLADDVFGLSDVAKIARLKLRLAGRKSRDSVPPGSTSSYLQDAGFSRRSVDLFFKPFFGGVFLDSNLDTPAAMFEFVFRMFAKSGAALPANGMAEIPAQLARRLPDENILTGKPVRRLEDRTVVFADGDRMTGSSVVVATDADASQSLASPTEAPAWRGATTIYYAAERSPLDRPTLALNGDDNGPVNHVCVPSDVAPGYAPAGASLVSATALDGGNGPASRLEDTVRDQMVRWFGQEAWTWKKLTSYSIPRALPANCFNPATTHPQSARVRPGVYACGDYLANPSINGAIASGRSAAYAVLQDVKPRWNEFKPRLASGAMSGIA